MYEASIELLNASRVTDVRVGRIPVAGSSGTMSMPFQKEPNVIHTLPLKSE